MYTTTISFNVWDSGKWKYKIYMGIISRRICQGQIFRIAQTIYFELNKYIDIFRLELGIIFKKYLRY